MNYWESHTQVAVRFRRFDRKRYAAFRSMHKVINIGVVTASTLLFALPDTAQAQKAIEPNRTGEEASVELEEVEVTASRAPIARNQATKIVTVIPAREIAAAPCHQYPRSFRICRRNRRPATRRRRHPSRYLHPGRDVRPNSGSLKRGQPLQPTNWPL